jgi:hypothetical protein
MTVQSSASGASAPDRAGKHLLMHNSKMMIRMLTEELVAETATQGGECLGKIKFYSTTFDQPAIMGKNSG